jgi:hypothetical protein
MNTITINETEYTVTAVREFSHNGATRHAISVRLPRGRKIGEVVRYENGLFGDVVFA